MNKMVVGVDLAKKVIQVCVYANNKVHSNTEMTPKEFTYWLANSKSATIVFEACGTWGLKPNGTKTYYKDFLPMSMGALNAITMKIKMQYYKRSYWNILFRTKMKDARKNLIR